MHSTHKLFVWRKSYRKEMFSAVLLLRKSPEDPQLERLLQNWTELCKLMYLHCAMCADKVLSPNPLLLINIIEEPCRHHRPVMQISYSTLILLFYIISDWRPHDRWRYIWHCAWKYFAEAPACSAPQGSGNCHVHCTTRKLQCYCKYLLLGALKKVLVRGSEGRLLLSGARHSFSHGQKCQWHYWLTCNDEVPQDGAHAHGQLLHAALAAASI